MNYFFYLFLCFVLFGSAAAETDITVSYVTGNPGIQGQVLDAETGAPLPARIELVNNQGQAVASYYSRYPGHFTQEDGTFKIDAEPGSYKLEVFHGIDYVSERTVIEIKKNQTADLHIQLQPWVRLRKMGWVNGDGHAHLYTDQNENVDMLKTVRRICRAQGVDFIATNQGWAGYGDDNWREGYAPFSDDELLLYYGAEMPKYRTGHTWWLGMESTRGYFSAAMDSSYENQYYKVESTPHWTFDNVPFPNIPAVYLVPRFKQAEDALACIPHPTSWWWEKRGAVEKYTTNVCEYLSYSLLAGPIWDGLVVMGYNADHYFYQNLWFHILNEGYRMTPLAELDGGYGENNKFPYGLYRVFYQVGDKMSMETIVDAAAKGRTFITSGPIIFATIDNTFQVGDEIPADGQSRTLNIQAYASGKADDVLSYVLIFRNGEIFRMWDVRDRQLRQFEQSIILSEMQDAWYVVKAYGKDAQSPEHLDVLSVCGQIAKGEFNGVINSEADVCLTSPFYFVTEKRPKLLQPNVKMSIISPGSQTPVKDVSITLKQDGRVINTLSAPNGQVEFEMPLNAILQIGAPGYPTIHRGLYLDYEPHQQLIETFANGDWLKQHNWQDILVPGQVPWEAFQFEKTKDILSKVEWIIELEPNERDGLWQDFEALFME